MWLESQYKELINLDNVSRIFFDLQGETYYISAELCFYDPQEEYPDVQKIYLGDFETKPEALEYIKEINRKLKYIDQLI